MSLDTCRSDDAVDLVGRPLALDRQMVPTYYVSEDNQLVDPVSQGDPEAFIALDSTSETLPSDVP